MSITAITWALLAVALTLLPVVRPAYALGLYMLTFFAAPHLWWWGRELPQLRYALIAGIVLLAAAAFTRPVASDGPRRRTRTEWAAIAIAVNATFVHFVIASNPSVSLNDYVELLKYILLFFLIGRVIRDRADMHVVILSIALGAAYIGYEVTINERGDFRGSRLEGVGAPGADTSNGLASVMLMTLPLIGSLFFAGKFSHKVVAVAGAPLVLNVVLLCNSRGAFLGLIGAALVYLALARGQARKQAMKALALGAVALYMMLGDPDILNRFLTTFSGSEDMDRSAASRLQFWQAGLLMLTDYPLGDGGGAFKFLHGQQYLVRVIGDQAPERALHNGYLTEATSWGIQGLTLRLIFIGAAALAAYHVSRQCEKEGRVSEALLGNCLIAAAVAFLITSVFGSYIQSEWSYWIVGLMFAYSSVYALAPVEAVDKTPQAAPRPAAQWTTARAIGTSGQGAQSAV